MTVPKYDECIDCYFYEREPAICDNCVNASEFEPAEPDDDAMDILRCLSRPGKRVIRIARFTEEEVREAERLKEAA